MTTTSPAPLELVEVAPRDGFQSIADPLPTERKIEVIQALLDAGILPWLTILNEVRSSKSATGPTLPLTAASAMSGAAAPAAPPITAFHAERGLSQIV